MNDVDLFTCEHVFSLLDDYLDRELTAEQMSRVRVHLDTCIECAREYKFEAQVIQSVREKIARIDCPSYLLERVTQEILKAQTE